MSGSGNGKAPDPIDAAIAAASTPAAVQGATVQITLPTGRPAVLTVPVDVTDTELVGLVAAAIQFAMQLRSQRPASRILLPQ